MCQSITPFAQDRKIYMTNRTQSFTQPIDATRGAGSHKSTNTQNSNPRRILFVCFCAFLRLNGYRGGDFVLHWRRELFLLR